MNTYNRIYILKKILLRKVRKTKLPQTKSYFKQRLIHSAFYRLLCACALTLANCSVVSALAQIDELKSCIEEREEELTRLRTATVSPFCWMALFSSVWLTVCVFGE